MAHETAARLHPAQTAAFDWPASAEWQEVNAELPEKAASSTSASTPPKARTGLEIQSIELRGKDGKAQRGGSPRNPPTMKPTLTLLTALLLAPLAALHAADAPPASLARDSGPAVNLLQNPSFEEKAGDGVEELDVAGLGRKGGDPVERRRRRAGPASVAFPSRPIVAATPPGRRW